ncbi:MAG: DUF4382 domain-containing protein, partial [Gammaproteobacteria bacterium]|nr:DUF4382 domain-containing protein [Gammaproteobacteria bacterium]
CGGGGVSGAVSGGSGGVASPTACTSNCGGALVSLTDAPGDFLSYLVTVDSLTLQRSDGTVVQTLPVKTTVDFAQLVNLSEIVSAAQIPEGSYVSASMTLDYSGATIVVDNGNGGVTIAPTQIIDGQTSQPLVAPNSTMTLNLSLPSNQPLVVTHGTVANLALDFNLSASNAITPSPTSPTTVTVNPVLSGSLIPDPSKQIRVRGGLVSVNAGAGTYLVNVHPFEDDNSTDSGQATVTTTASTTFTINGVNVVGAAGLAQLATVPAGTMTAAFGTLDQTTMTFTATNVLAGTSVVGSGGDGVQGSVLSRTGDTLTIANGDTLSPSSQDGEDVHYVRQLTATIGSGTSVSALGGNGALSTQDISVGQRIELTGTLSTDGSGNTALDATSGTAVLLPTRIIGTLSGAVSNGVATVALQAIDGQDPATFNFAGTGATSAQDAVASAYTVAIPQALSTGGLSAGAPVGFVGTVTSFGTAPPDFNAVTIVDFANTAAQLHLEWPDPGQAAPFATLTNAQLSIAPSLLAAADEFELSIGPEKVAVSSLASGITLAPDLGATNPVYLIVTENADAEQETSYSTFNDFVTALTQALNGTATVSSVSAEGGFDASTGTMSVSRMVVHFH